jgi:hypothetical protein
MVPPNDLPAGVDDDLLQLRVVKKITERLRLFGDLPPPLCGFAPGLKLRVIEAGRRARPCSAPMCTQP